MLPSEQHVLKSRRNDMGNQEEVLVSRAVAALKRVAPIMADARTAQHGSKHRRTNSRTSSPSGRGDLSRRRFFAGSSGSGVDKGTRVVQGGVGLVGIKTEEGARESRERAASFAADRDLDEAFLASFGVSLTVSQDDHGSSGHALSSVGSFDPTRVISRSMEASNAAINHRSGDAGGDAEAREKWDYEFRRRKAEATLSKPEYKCWVIRQEVEGYRRQEEELRSKIYNGDPLLPL